MARTKKEKVNSAAENTLLDVRQKLEVAQTAHNAKPSKDTEAKVASAKAAVADATKAVNRERFVRVGGQRVKKARAALRNLASVNSLRSYNYTADDINKAEKVLTDELNSAISKMRSGLTTTAKVNKPDEESLFA
jgi:hypothetical protein